MEQLEKNELAQNWSAIFYMPDSKDQVIQFNLTSLWLLGRHAILHRQFKQDTVNPCFQLKSRKNLDSVREKQVLKFEQRHFTHSISLIYSSLQIKMFPPGHSPLNFNASGLNEFLFCNIFDFEVFNAIH
jgi:hypothetical protein